MIKIYLWLLFVYAAVFVALVIFRLSFIYILPLLFSDIFPTWRSVCDWKGSPWRCHPSLLLSWFHFLTLPVLLMLSLPRKKKKRYFLWNLAHLYWQICYFILNLSLLFDWGAGCSSPSSKQSAILGLPMFFFSSPPPPSWSCYCLSQSHCCLVRIAISVNSRNLVRKSSYSNEQK